MRFVKAVPENILPLWAVLVSAVLFLAIWGAMGSVEYVLRQGTVIWEGECTMAGWTEDGDIGLKVDCGMYGTGKITRPSSVRSYMQNPGPLTCRASRAVTLDCDKRPEVSGG